MEEPHRTGEPAEETEETESGRGGELRSLAEREAEHRRSAAGGRLQHVASALDAAATSLENEGEPRLGRVAGGLAERAERAGRYLRDRDVPAIVDDLEGRARRDPGRFLVGSALAGLVVGHLLRASDHTYSAPSRDGGGDDHG